MDLFQRISEHCNESAQLKLEVLSSLIPSIVEAAECICSAIVDSRKVIAFSDLSCLFFSSYFVSKMTGGIGVPRPGFPAIEVFPYPSSLPIIQNLGYAEAFSRQLDMFAHPGDVLLIIAPKADVVLYESFLMSARERDLRILALTTCGSLSPFLLESDVVIDIFSQSFVRSEEVRLFVINCSCDAIDCILLGMEDI